MARDYRIKEILEYESDSSGFVRVEFRITGDPKDKVRYLESGSYVDWVESLDSNRRYTSESFGYELYDEDFHAPPAQFDFDEWKDENEDESFIKKFIYENFSINDLPDPE